MSTRRMAPAAAVPTVPAQTVLPDRAVSPDRAVPAVRWLDAEERAAWLSIVRVAARLPAVLDAQLQRDANLSFTGYLVLAMLSEQPDGTLGMSQLAAVANLSPSRLSHLAKRLEAQDLMRRELDRDDGRCTNAILTATGRSTVEQAAPTHVAAVRELVIDAVSPAQLGQLRAANERILERIDPDATTRPPTA